ncbi:acyl carrier protein [Vibrio spartinae]|uniref:Acyl carrier protein n=1 Tax=Vibrio spartinae TaxID=1918945 RepID=A0A1N6M564_9VIBR|nr:acyl carrier protein [Vibrio spartinae]QMV15009.1 acyl carrier protein [Vibrio spartinae]SIO94589.1 acyl carrier protein [Vibrio spartinae]
MNIMDKINEALSQVLDGETVTIDMNTNFDEDLDLDSVLFVQFLLTLEENIDGLLFDPDLISQSSFNNVGSLIEFIESQVTVAEA